MGLRKNAAIVKASDGFCAIRGSHMKDVFLEAYQVSEQGDLANIEKGNKVLPSPGSQMDLAAAGPKSKVIALMELESEGKCNLLKHCTYRLTGKKCLSKLITDKGVFEFKEDGMHLIELAPGVTANEIKNIVHLDFKVEPNIKTMKI